MKNRNFFCKSLMLLLAVAITCGAIQLQDPTRPPILPAATSIATPIKVLSAIFFSRTKRVAIINGKSYRLGDKLDGFTITAIRPYSVELLGAGGVKEVLYLVPVIKQRSIYKDICFNG